MSQRDFEITVVITITGYESLRAASAEEAEAKMEQLLHERFQFSAPLVQKSAEFSVTAEPRRSE